LDKLKPVFSAFVLFVFLWPSTFSSEDELQYCTIKSRVDAGREESGKQRMTDCQNPRHATFKTVDTMDSSYCDSIMCRRMKRLLIECVTDGWLATSLVSTYAIGPMTMSVQ